MHVDLGKLVRRDKLAGGKEKNLLHRATRNGVWLSAILHRLNGTELSQEELWDNLRLRYGLMSQDIPTTCDYFGKKFLIMHALSCPKGGLVLAWNDDPAKEWNAIGAQALVPSAITYEPKINSTTVQGERTGAGARQENGPADGGMDTVGESQGGSRRTVNRVVILEGQTGQLQVPAELRADISFHGFLKRGTTAMFDIQIFNFDVGSYLCMTP